MSPSADQVTDAPSADAPSADAETAGPPEATPAGKVARRTTRKAPVLDSVAAKAVDLARAAAVEIADRGSVGDHLGVEVADDRTVLHSFACTMAGYRGWQWSVVVTRAPRARTATVSEACLLPTPDAVLAPQWLPWEERLAPGDVGPGDVLPRREDDVRLDEGYEATGDDDADQLALAELGLGRPRVLSFEGRAEAAERWYAGDHGPRAAVATEAKASCGSCGFVVPVAGALRAVFGVCANEWSPSDGAVVSYDHGCGAHSETDVERTPESLPEPVLDDLRFDEA